MDEQGPPRLKYEVNTKALDRLTNTYLGKNILITNREEWSEEKIILAYRSQYLIENVFKEMKDRRIGGWWPMYHWTDSKIRVHALYCTIAVLLRGLLLRRIRGAGIDISMKRLLRELEDIREVINVYPRKRGQRGPSANGIEQNERTSRPPAVDLGPAQARRTRFRVTGGGAQPVSSLEVTRTLFDNL